MTLPLTITADGAVVTSPADLRTEVVAIAQTLSPDITTTLPGSMIEDLTSTSIGAASLCDQAYVDAVNSVAPQTANLFVLNLLGQLYGVRRGLDANASVYLVFSGLAGYMIMPGFSVTDGAHEYVVQDGGIIDNSGYTIPLYAVATVYGVWPIPPNSITTVSTSVPSEINLTVTNPNAGLQPISSQTDAQYRAFIMRSGKAAAQGMPSLMKSALQNVVGVQARLVSIQQQGYYWKIICGGGDPYSVANAIYNNSVDFQALIGSTLYVTHITNAVNGVVTTSKNHGLFTGEVVTISGVLGMTGINGVPLTITVVSKTTFNTNIDTTTLGHYSSGGSVTPNPRNQIISVLGYPDIYTITFVTPLQQNLSVYILWGAPGSANIVSNAAVAQLGSAAIIEYVMNIYVGQPINVYALMNAFQEAVKDLIPIDMLGRFVPSFTIDGVAVVPETGTGLIYGDNESYFYTDSSMITILKG
jgi:hypothetical protein